MPKQMYLWWKVMGFKRLFSKKCMCWYILQENSYFCNILWLVWLLKYPTIKNLLENWTKTCFTSWGYFGNLNTKFCATVYKAAYFSYFYIAPYMLAGWLKGQLISKGLFGVIVSTKKPTKFFLRISGLASKKRSDQKIKALYITN